MQGGNMAFGDLSGMGQIDTAPPPDDSIGPAFRAQGSGRLDSVGPGAEQPGREPVIVPVQGEGATVELGQTPDLTVNKEAAGTEASAIPGGARPLGVNEGAAIEAATRGVAEAAAPAGAEEVVIDAGEEEQGEPVDVKVATDPNAKARAAVEGVGKMGGATTLEDLVGNPSGKPKGPTEAPEISADGFPSRGLDVPPVRTVTPAETTAAGSVATQTLINTSGLPGTLPPPAVVERQIPVAPAELPAAPVEEPAPQPEQTVEAEDPTKLVDEFLAIDPATMIKESGGVADRSSFLLAAQYRDVQIHMRNLREAGKPDTILAPIVKDYKNALEAKSGEAS